MNKLERKQRSVMRWVSITMALVIILFTIPQHASAFPIFKDIMIAFSDLFDPPLPIGHPTQPHWLGTSADDYARLGITPGAPQIWEDGLRTNPNEYSFEWWYFDAHFDDSSSVMITFFTKPQTTPDAPLTPIVYVSFLTPTGEKIEKNLQVAVQDSYYSTTECNVQIGDNYIYGNLGTYNIFVTDGDFELNLTLTRQVPTWRPETGATFLGDENSYFAWLPAVATGLMEGTITYQGTTHQVTGSGYHDHNWGNVDLAKNFKYWWWTRSQVGPYTIMTAAERLKNKFGYDQWEWMFVILDQNGALIDAAQSDVTMSVDESNFQIHPDPNSFELIAQTVTFRVEKGNGDWAEIVVNTENLNTSSDLLLESGLSDSEVILARLLGKTPWYSNFSALVDLSFSIDGTSYSDHGHGTLEKMDLE